MCAATGQLDGQGNPVIIFATAPNSLVIDRGPNPLDVCGGWMPPEARRFGDAGWANDDIFFLEVCLFNQMCNNGPALFQLRVGERFNCDFSPRRAAELQSILERPAPPHLLSKSACGHGTLDTSEMTCAKCWQINEGEGDCSRLSGCNSRLCSFCTNLA